MRPRFDPNMVFEFEVRESPAWGALENAAAVVAGDALLVGGYFNTPEAIREYGVGRALESHADLPGFRGEFEAALERYINFSTQLVLRLPVVNN
jgi:hypothetical protein